jgi:phage tail sheath protein FI
LAAGATGSAVTESDIANAMSSFDTVTSSLVLNAPGVVGTSPMNTILSYAESRDDVFVVIDAMNDTVTNQMTRAATYTSTSLGAVYYPNLTIPSNTSSSPDAVETAFCGGAIVGQFISTDVSRGVFKAPAGVNNRIAGAVAVQKLTNANLDTMNSASAPVNAIRFIPGSGIVVMGSRTLKAGYADRYVPVRRSLIYLRKALTDLTDFAVFEPNDAVLWRRIKASLEGFLTDYWSQGGLRGATPADAFFVKCDSSTNTLIKIDNGEVNMEIGVALQRPAEFVIIKIGQYDGGTTVTVA